MDVKTVQMHAEDMGRKNITDRMYQKALIYCIFFISFLFFKCSASEGWYGIPSNAEAYNMRLITASNSANTLHSISEKFIYLSFGYQKCRGICPNTAAVLYRLSREIQDNDILFLFGELMPEKNRIEEIQKELNLFGERFKAFTADSEEEMRSNAGKFHEYFDSGKGQISHTGNIYLIDSSKNIRLIYPDKYRNTDRMKEDYERLRKEYGRK